MSLASFLAQTRDDRLGICWAVKLSKSLDLDSPFSDPDKILGGSELFFTTYHAFSTMSVSLV